MDGLNGFERIFDVLGEDMIQRIFDALGAGMIQRVLTSWEDGERILTLDESGVSRELDIVD